MNGLNQSGGRIVPGEDRLEVEAVRPISEWTQPKWWTYCPGEDPGEDRLEVKAVRPISEWTQPKWWTYCPGRGQTGSESGSSHK